MIRPCDMMTVSLARLIRDGETVFHGVSSHMPMIAVLLAKKLHAPNAVHLNIPGGVDPAEPELQSWTSAGGELWETACAALPLQEVFDLSMRGGLDVAFLSGVQFDQHGRVNASVIGDYHRPKVRLPGGAGSAVLIPMAKRAILWRTKHDKRTFTENIHPYSSLEEVAANTGFPIRYFSADFTPEPTAEEMRALREIDPRDLRNLEFR